MTCCWCRWSQPAIMAMRTCRIIGFPRLQAVTRWCAPVYYQAEIFQQGSVSRLFQPYEVWRIWHPPYGVIYDELEVMRRGKYASQASRADPTGKLGRTVWPAPGGISVSLPGLR